MWAKTFKVAVLPALSVVAIAVGVAACGEKRAPEPPMSQGERLSLSSGCSACHGPSFEGGMGPKWTGLYMSQVTLDGGVKVTADDTYLTTAIKDPSVQHVKGTSVMPPNQLSDADIAAIVEFIKTLK